MSIRHEIRRRKGADMEFLEMRKRVARDMNRVAIDMRLDDKIYATACVLYHSFLQVEDPLNADCEKVAIASFWVVSKAGDDSRRLREFVNAFEAVTKAKPAIKSMKEYWAVRDSILQYEHSVLTAVGFNTRLISHFDYLFNFCRQVNAPEKIAVASYAALNDCFTLPLCIKFSEAELACCCLTMTFLSLTSIGQNHERLEAPLEKLRNDLKMGQKRLTLFLEQFLEGVGDLLEARVFKDESIAQSGTESNDSQGGPLRSIELSISPEEMLEYDHQNLRKRTKEELEARWAPKTGRNKRNSERVNIYLEASDSERQGRAKKRRTSGLLGGNYDSD
eukprot:gene130-307_t